MDKGTIVRRGRFLDTIVPAYRARKVISQLGIYKNQQGQKLFQVETPILVYPDGWHIKVTFGIHDEAQCTEILKGLGLIDKTAK